MKPTIKVGFLVSYDWYLLKNAIPLIYSEAHKIYLALDKQRLTWMGNSFNFDEKAFQQMIESIDTDKKIYIYEDDFYASSLTPMQCEVRERNLLSKRMGDGGWHIQLDADEYFLNFKGFVEYLQKMSLNQKEINICVVLISLFKKTENGFLYPVSRNLDLIQVATNKPYYEYGRKNGYFNHISPFFILHDTWARSEEEIWQKMSNWGHKNDFDIEKYFKFWKSIDEKSYKNMKDFHPLEPKIWPSLEFLMGNSIEETIKNAKNKKFPLSKLQLLLKNNRNFARIKMLLSKLKFK